MNKCFIHACSYCFCIFQLAIELWGPSSGSATSLASLVTSLLQGSPLTSNAATCGSTSSFVVRLKYLRVDPLTSNISYIPLSLRSCPMNCPLDNFINLFEDRVPNDIYALCKKQSIAGVVEAMPPVEVSTIPPSTPEPQTDPPIAEKTAAQLFSVFVRVFY